MSRAGDAVDWAVERRRWAKLRAEVRRALKAGAADYVAQHTQGVASDDSFFETGPAAATAVIHVSPPAPETIPAIMDIVAQKVRTPIDPPPPIVVKPKAKGVPKAKLNIKADDLPLGMETLAQSWKQKP